MIVLGRRRGTVSGKAAGRFGCDPALALVLAVGMVLTSCAISPATPTRNPAISVDAAGIATYPVTPDFLCADVFLSGEIHGDPARRPPVWLATSAGGKNEALIWPSGTIVQLRPSLVVIAPDATVIAREGDHVDVGACVLDGDEGRSYLVIRMNAWRLR